jgi:hypothetical protein
MMPSDSPNIINKIYMFEIKCLIHHDPSHNVFKLVPITTGATNTEIDFPFSYIEPKPEDVLTTMAIFEISDPYADEQEMATSLSSSFNTQENINLP